MFPATAARDPRARRRAAAVRPEIDVPGATPRCIRVLVHLHTDRTRAELHHVYLHGARGLRDDLPE